MFFCKLCNYKSDKNCNYKRHLKSKKHIMNSLPIVPKKYDNFLTKNKVLQLETSAPQKSTMLHKNKKIVAKIKKLSCEYCNIIFTRSNNLSKHYKTCIERKDSLENNKLKIELMEYKKALHDKDKYIKEKNIQIQKLENNFKEFIQNLGNMGPKNVNAITYIINNYNDAPHIESIKPNDIKQLTFNSNRDIEDFISYYKNNTLINYIVEAILFIYKKDDPTKQSVWVTDTSRYNYIIKELLHDKDSKWVIDKKGVKSEKYLVQPILNFIRKKIYNYLQVAGDMLMNNKLNKDDIEIIINSQKYGCDLVKDIDDNVLSTEIIKKLSKHMHYDQNNIYLIEEEIK